MAKKPTNSADEESFARRLAEFSAQRTSDHEEIRFTKKQQWAVTVAGLAITLVVYGAAKSARPTLGPSERLGVLAIILIVPFVCSYYLWDLQEHLSRVRQNLNPNDENAFRRGLDALGIFAFILFFSSILLGYALYR